METDRDASSPGRRKEASAGKRGDSRLSGLIAHVHIVACHLLGDVTRQRHHRVSRGIVLRHLGEALVPEIVDAEAIQSGWRGQLAPSGAHQLLRLTEVEILVLACREEVMVRFAST